MKGDMEMSKLLRSITSSRVPYGQGKGYGRLAPDERYESATPSFTVRVPRKLRIVKFGSRRTTTNSNQQSNNSQQLSKSGQPDVEQPGSTFLGRLRVRYERMMLKAASKSGTFTSIPVAKASRAPAALSSALNTWTVSSSFGSRKGTKIADLDPGFKMTAVEKNGAPAEKLREAFSGTYMMEWADPGPHPSRIVTHLMYQAAVVDSKSTFISTAVWWKEDTQGTLQRKLVQTGEHGRNPWAVSTFMKGLVMASEDCSSAQHHNPVGPEL